MERLAGTSGLWALAALTRPQYLPAWLLLPAALWVRQHSPRELLRGAAVLAVGAAFFLAYGLWQHRVCGEFRVIPWQGPYNLWAANEPGANGRYYEQRLNLAYTGNGGNPAQMESILRYHAETGGADGSIGEMNAHWRRCFLDYVCHHPVDWLRLMAVKTYVLLNDWEQYNNKTFAFQKSLSPWLRWNPIGWGVLLMLAVAGFRRLQTRAGSIAATAAAIAVVYAAGVLLFYVSGRFRLPLAALGCVMAGGALARPFFWRGLAPAARASLAVALCVAGFVAFSGFCGVRDIRTVIQDRLLIARAAQVCGDDAETWRQAQVVIAADATRADAHEYALTSGFNRLLAGDLPPADLPAWRRSARSLLASTRVAPLPATVIAASLERDSATLHALVDDSPQGAGDALGALFLLGAANDAEREKLVRLPLESGSAFFLMARQALAPAEFSAWAVASSRSPRWVGSIETARRRLFGP